MNLSRTNFIFTIVNLALVIFMLTQVRQAASPEASSTLRAQAIGLVGAGGTVRSRLNVEDSGEVMFRLFDHDGAIRVKLGAAHDGSGLLLNNDATEPGIHIHAKAEGSNLSLRDKNGAELKLAP